MTPQNRQFKLLADLASGYQPTTTILAGLLIKKCYCIFKKDLYLVHCCL